jgi:hypothetical protein
LEEGWDVEFGWQIELELMVEVQNASDGFDVGQVRRPPVASLDAVERRVSVQIAWQVASLAGGWKRAKNIIKE